MYTYVYIYIYIHIYKIYIYRPDFEKELFHVFCRTNRYWVKRKINKRKIQKLT